MGRAQVPEAHMEAGDGGVPGSIDGALARVEAALTGGDLLAAADALEAGCAGTAAAPLAATWVAAARSRAAAEQAVRLLQAHAATLAASRS
jgi:hypothetical protein